MSSSEPQVGVQIHTAFDPTGDAYVQLITEGVESSSGTLCLPADQAEALALHILQAAARAKLMGGLFRDLTLKSGWDTGKALEFIGETP